MPVEIRSAILSEADEIRRLAVSVAVTTVGDDETVRAEIAANVEGNIDYWLRSPEACVHIVAVEAGSIVGVVLVKEFWNLCSLFVSPEYQGRGLGRALVDAAATSCRGRSPKQALWLNAATNAIGFYKHLGFEPREASKPLPAGFMAMQISL